jgi:hypothetical protein
MRLARLEDAPRLLRALRESPRAYLPDQEPREIDILFGVPKERQDRIGKFIRSMRTSQDTVADDIPPRRLITTLRYMIEEYNIFWHNQVVKYKDNPTLVGLDRSPASIGMFAGQSWTQYSMRGLRRARKRFLESLIQEETLVSKQILSVVNTCGGLSRPVLQDLLIEGMLSTYDGNADAELRARTILPYLEYIGLLTSGVRSVANSYSLAPAYCTHE